MRPPPLRDLFCNISGLWRQVWLDVWNSECLKVWSYNDFKKKMSSRYKLRYIYMTQNVIDFDRPRSSAKVNILHCKPYPIHEYTYEVPLRFQYRFCSYWVKSGKEKKIMRETLWCTLTLCDANYAMMEQLCVQLTYCNLKITFLTFIWHELCPNTLSCYRNNAPVTFPKFFLKW